MFSMGYKIAVLCIAAIFGLLVYITLSCVFKTKIDAEKQFDKQQYVKDNREIFGVR